MVTPAVKKRYVTDNVTTTSPNALVTMMYDRLVRDINEAITALAAADIGAAHQPLLNAQQIVSELTAALDVDKWPGGATLRDVYVYLEGQLVTTNVTKNERLARECLQIAEPLRDAWQQAAAAPKP